MNIKEEILRALAKTPLTPQELCESIGIAAPAAEAAEEELIKLCYLVRSRSGKLGLPEQFGLYRGRLEMNRRGYGFVRREGGDVYIPKEDLAGAMHTQTVLVRTEGTGRLSGRVLRASDEPFFVTGSYQKTPEGSLVIPDDPLFRPLHVNKKLAMGAKYGDKVIAQLTRPAAKYRPAEGAVTEVLGSEGDKGVDILSAARRYGLFEEFPEPVEAEAASVSAEQPELSSRELLFDKTIFTIDGEDAKDLDDAVSLETLANGNFLLGVHIADVTHYVKEGSSLDKEALKRGTSVYLLDRVIPMLPRALSNGACSLNAGETKLTLSCFMELLPSGEVISSRVAKTAIRSCRRMTYTAVNAMIYGDEAARKKYLDIAPAVELMDALAQRLRKKRFSEGAIDFDIPEAKIELDKDGRPERISIRKHDRAEMLIEEFMICANNSVAADYFYRELPFLFRVHEKPDPAKLREFSVFLKNTGFAMKGGSAQGKALSGVLEETEGSPAENIIKRLMLRSMKKAKYSPVNLGHFGLASPAYSHFTSPIRRYPDLQIHRIIKEELAGELTDRELKRYEVLLPVVAEQCCERELNALEAERTVDDMKKAEYMEGREGERFTGVVSGVTSRALFIELENTVEGILPLSDMNDDYYEYIENQYCVIGKRTRKRYSLGDSAEVTLTAADSHSGRIEFSLASSKPRRNVVRYRRRQR